jgi:cytochrome c556
MGTHFSRIGAVVKGEKPFNKEEVAANAAVVANLAHLPWQAFGPGTEGGKSLPEIWKESDKFKASSEKMQKAVAELNTAAKGGDLDTIKKAFGAAGQSCKACHDNYRKK